MKAATSSNFEPKLSDGFHWESSQGSECPGTMPEAQGGEASPFGNTSLSPNTCKTTSEW